MIERFARLATSTLANALDEAGLHDNVVDGIVAAAPGLRLAGRAVMVKQSAGDYGTYESADFKVGAMIDAAGPGDVIVVDAGGCAYSTWGGMASYAAKLKGIAGIVIDGAARDREEIVEFGFPVFARQLVPTTGRMRLKVEAIDVPVTIGGVAVAPRDVVVADGTGIVVVPAAQCQAVLDFAERCAADDAAALADLDAGLSFAQAMAKYKRI